MCLLGMWCLGVVLQLHKIPPLPTTLSATQSERDVSRGSHFSVNIFEFLRSPSSTFFSELDNFLSIIVSIGIYSQS